MNVILGCKFLKIIFRINASDSEIRNRVFSAVKLSVPSSSSTETSVGRFCVVLAYSSSFKSSLPPNNIKPFRRHQYFDCTLLEKTNQGSLKESDIYLVAHLVIVYNNGLCYASILQLIGNNSLSYRTNI